MLRWGVVDKDLAGKSFLMGEQFTVADAYLFNMTLWAKRGNLDMSGLTNINAFAARVAARPTVQAAMKAEGLI
jgi:glutathione S-transferase